ncbi:MAG: YesL family protein [Lachnospiraceae bacterium]|nr:YesL family protein [Lachnospiraceae bacterium]
MIKIFSSDSAFSRFMNLLFDILYVGILWIICCVPLITAGASTTAAYYAMAKCVRHKTGYIGREFLKSFKSNFRQILPLTLVFWVVSGVLAVDVYYIWNHESRLNNALFVVLVFLCFLVSGLVIYICPLLSRFHKKNTELIKTAAYVLFKFLPLTIGILFMFLAVCAAVYLMPWAIFVLPGLYLFGLSYPMEYVLKKLMPPAQEDSEEAQKWYYQ